MLYLIKNFLYILDEIDEKDEGAFRCFDINTIQISRTTDPSLDEGFEYEVEDTTNENNSCYISTKEFKEYQNLFKEHISSLDKLKFSNELYFEDNFIKFHKNDEHYKRFFVIPISKISSVALSYRLIEASVFFYTIDNRYTQIDINDVKFEDLEKWINKVFSNNKDVNIETDNQLVL